MTACFEALLAAPVESESMDIPRETIAQVGVSVLAVALFIAGLLYLSDNYGTVENGQTVMTNDGGLLLVALIAAFIILMPVVGYMLERADFDAE